MKLIIRSSDAETKVVKLNKDISFSAQKGQQFIFSDGFSSYTMSFKDNQKSIDLNFQVAGKAIKVSLKGIVPLLNSNQKDLSSPSALVINKSINEEVIDNVINNNLLNGNEVIYSLEMMMEDQPNSLALATDFASLVETLEAAAAGEELVTQRNSGINAELSGSVEDSLIGLQETAVWNNLDNGDSFASLQRDSSSQLFNLVGRVEQSDTTPPVVHITEITPIDSKQKSDGVANKIVIKLSTDEPYGTVLIKGKYGVITTGKTDANGNFVAEIYTTSVQEGAIVIAEVRDQVGNVGIASGHAGSVVIEQGADITAPLVNIVEVTPIDTKQKSDGVANKVVIKLSTDEPNGTVIIKDKYGVVITTGKTDSRGEFVAEVNTTKVQEGDLIIAEVSDPAGNIGIDSKNAGSLIFEQGADITAPLVNITEVTPIDTKQKSDGVADKVVIKLSTDESNGTVVIKDKTGAIITTGKTDANGDFTAEIYTTSVQEGDLIIAEVRDPAGNVGIDSKNAGSLVFEQGADVTAPLVNITEVTPIDSKQKSDGVANKVVVKVSSDEPNGDVVIKDKTGAVIATGKTDANGNFVTEIHTTSVQENDKVTAEVSDPAGNVGTDSKNAGSLIFEQGSDITAPLVNITEVTPIDSKQKSDGVADKVVIKVSTDEPNGTVVVKDKNDVVIATGKTDVNGDFTAEINTTSVQENDKVTVEVRDPAGNVGTDSKNAGSLIFEQGADVTAPLVNITEVTPIDAKEKSDGVANKVLVKLSTDEPNGDVVIKDKKGAVIATGKTDSKGDFVAEINTTSVQTGDLVTAEVSDPVGNVGIDSKNAGTLVFEQGADTTPPLVNITEITPIDSKQKSDGVANKVVVKVSSDEPNGDVVIKDKTGAVIATGKTDSNGNFMTEIYTTNVQAGDIVTAEVSDQAKNVGTDSKNAGTLVFEQGADVTAPLVNITEITPIDSKQKSDGVANKVVVKVSSDEPNGDVVIKDKTGAVIATGKTDSNGDFTAEIYTTSVQENDKVTVEVRDPAGNVGIDSKNAGTLVFEQGADITPPLVNITEVTPINSKQKSDGVADKVLVKLSTDEPNGDVVILSPAGEIIATGKTDANGDFVIEIHTDKVQEGDRLIADVSDQAGNVGRDVKFAGTLVFEQGADTTPPLVNIIEITPIDSKQKSDGVANKVVVKVSSDEPNGDVVIKDKTGAVIATGKTDTNGYFVTEIDTDKVQAGDEVTVEVTDPAGNIGIDSKNAGSLIFEQGADLEAPDAPVIVDIVDHKGDYSSVTMYGTGEPGATITLYSREGSTSGPGAIQGGAFIPVVTNVKVDKDGKWSIDISNLPHTPINDNEFFYVTATDGPGNTSVPSEQVHYFHGGWDYNDTNAFDDYIFLGDGDDVITIMANDSNNKLVIDGGNGEDTVRL